MTAPGTLLASQLASDRLARWRSILWVIWVAVFAALAAKPAMWVIAYYRAHLPPALYNLFLIALPLAAVACAIWLLIRRTGLWRYENAALAFTMAAIPLLYEPRATIVTAALVLAGLTLGRGISRRLQLNEAGIPAALAIDFALGCAVLMPVLCLLGIARAYYSLVFVAVLALPVVMFRSDAWDSLTLIGRALQPSRQPFALRDTLWGIAVFFAAAGLLGAFTVALTPSIAFDPLAMHLPAARYFAEHHAAEALPASEYSWFPQAFESMMALEWSLAGQAGAQLISPVFLLMLSVALIAIGRELKYGLAATMAGVVSAALIPALHWSGANAKNDVMMAFFEAASLYAFLRYERCRQFRWIAVSAVCLGSAFSVKHVALFGAIPLVLLFCFFVARQRHRRLRTAAAVLSLLLLSGTYWHARTWAGKGDPLYPSYLAQTFEGTHVKKDRSLARAVSRYAQLPVSILFRGQSAFESPLPNPVGLLLITFFPVTLLVPRRRTTGRRICWFFIGAYLLYWGGMLNAVRYAILPIALLAIIFAGKLGEFWELDNAWRTGVRGSTAVVLAACLLFNVIGISIIEVNVPEVLFLAHRLDTQSYLRRALRTYDSISALSAGKIMGRVLGVNNCSRLYAPDPGQFYCLMINHKGDTGNIATRIASGSYPYVILPSGELGRKLLTDAGRDDATVRYAGGDFTVFELKKP